MVLSWRKSSSTQHELRRSTAITERRSCRSGLLIWAVQSHKLSEFDSRNGQTIGDLRAAMVHQSHMRRICFVITEMNMYETQSQNKADDFCSSRHTHRRQFLQGNTRHLAFERAFLCLVYCAELFSTDCGMQINLLIADGRPSASRPCVCEHETRVGMAHAWWSDFVGCVCATQPKSMALRSS